MKIEDRMSMWAAKRPRDEVAELLLEGSQEIADLRRESETHPDNVGKKLAQEIAILRSDISRRADLEQGLIAGVSHLQEEVRRLEEERESLERAIDALHGVDDMSAGASGRDYAAAATLRSLLDGRKDTPDLLAADVRRLEPVIAASQPTLTDEERGATLRGFLEPHYSCIVR